MLSLIDNAYISVKNRIRNFFACFKNEENGVAGFVVAIILVVIVVALCAIFWGYISEWFENTWNKIMGKADPIGETRTP